MGRVRKAEETVSMKKKNSDQLLIVSEDLLLSSVEYFTNDLGTMKDFESLGAFSLESTTSRVCYAGAFRLLVNKNQNITSRRLSKQNEAFLVLTAEIHPCLLLTFLSAKSLSMRCVVAMKKWWDFSSVITESFGLLCPFVGELTSYSLRETSADKSSRRSPNVERYTELRERGKPISGGFAISVDKKPQLLLEFANIKYSVTFPRWFKHLQYQIDLLSNDGIDHDASALCFDDAVDDRRCATDACVGERKIGEGS
ncbi:unnamed protein product [Angiostrongylus costaricensis]|uniref:tRNA-synt_2 domain-containing protein n=1 Tax=Angiostrongylus costaricensis TaxID=334426 RepID=A0A158PLP2_ANGCS|nr:unnamed protein product [Angiostrongylus costaricensis]